MAENTLKPGPADQMARLRTLLVEAGYTDIGLVAGFGSVPLPTRRNRGLPRFLRMTTGGTRLDVLVRLFLLGTPVPEAAARQALHPVGLETVLATGLLKRCGEEVAGAVALVPYDDLCLAVDHPEAVSTGAGPDLVMGLTASTSDLVHFAVRRQIRTAFDFGTGCGIQAFLAARHAGEVLAVDRSARSVSFARFNAALNGIPGVRIVEGDGFEPARGRRFDLIVGNLPFVISPAPRYLYRDSGLPLDGFAREAVRQAGEYLEEGGFCQFICEWVHLIGTDWKERLAGWFENCGCDVFMLRQTSANPLSYAECWVRDTEQDSPEVFECRFEEWASYYERERVEGISTGLIAMRRRSGAANWFHLEDAPARLIDTYGSHLERLFALHDFLAGASDDALLREPLAVAPELRLVSECEWTTNGWKIVGAQLRQAADTSTAGNVDRRSMELLARCDGKRPLRDVLSDMAANLGAPVENVAAAALPMVRQLIERGFLLAGEAARAARAD